MRRLSAVLTSLAVIFMVLGGLGTYTKSKAQEATPSFDYPQNTQVLDLEGDYQFKLKNTNPDRAYRWIFEQSNRVVWDSLTNAGMVSDGTFGIGATSIAHRMFHEGPVKVSVLTWQAQDWQPTLSIQIILKAHNSTPVPSATPLPCAELRLREQIAAGTPFSVRFDATATAFNDLIYTGNELTDPMGTLKGGETYQVSYKDGNWTTTGFSQAANGIITATYNNADPAQQELSLWGRVFLFSCSGNVVDYEYGLVGHISLQASTP